MEKATRVLSDEDREMMDRPIEGKNGELRKIEHILGRSKLKKSFQYEVKFKGLDHKVSFEIKQRLRPSASLAISDWRIG